MALVGGEEMKLAREKTWDEKDGVERVELLRRELRHARALLAEVSKEFRKLSQHTHAPDGSIVIPYRTASSGEDAPAGYRYDPLA